MGGDTWTTTRKNSEEGCGHCGGGRGLVGKEAERRMTSISCTPLLGGLGNRRRGNWMSAMRGVVIGGEGDVKW